MSKLNSRELRKIKSKPQALIAAGYRRVSNRSLTIARIDNPDWQEVLLASNPAILIAGNAEDYYRRKLSEDRIKLNASVFKAIPSSTCDSTGYINAEGDDIRSRVVLLKHDEQVTKITGTSVEKPLQTMTLSQKLRNFLAGHGIFSK